VPKAVGILWSHDKKLRKKKPTTKVKKSRSVTKCERSGNLRASSYSLLITAGYRPMICFLLLLLRKRFDWCRSSRQWLPASESWVTLCETAREARAEPYRGRLSHDPGTQRCGSFLPLFFSLYIFRPRFLFFLLLIRGLKRVYVNIYSCSDKNIEQFQRFCASPSF
jgi:hypothetical protein